MIYLVEIKFYHLDLWRSLWAHSEGSSSDWAALDPFGALSEPLCGLSAQSAGPGPRDVGLRGFGRAKTQTLAPDFSRRFAKHTPGVRVAKDDGRA
jgi:hypothetical protein